MSIYGLKGSIEKTERSPETSSILQTIWLKIHNIPDLARKVEVVKEIITPMAKLLVIDELSMIQNCPVSSM